MLVVGKAFSVLSDPDKRKQFDSFGVDPESRGGTPRSRQNGQFHEFDMEMTPEELFEMFFNGGFGPGGGLSLLLVSVTAAHHHQGFRRTHVRRQQHPFFRQQPTPTQAEGGFGFLHLLPLFMLLFLSLFNSYLNSEPSYTPFSLSRTTYHSTEKRTAKNQVPYFVNARVYRTEYSNAQRKLDMLEETVENSYIRAMAQRCEHESEVKRERIREARKWAWLSSDDTRIKEAENMVLPSCDELKRVRRQK
jgi:DnaJ family protein B protein 12